jgi:hypothetical protein
MKNYSRTFQFILVTAIVLFTLIQYHNLENRDKPAILHSERVIYSDSINVYQRSWKDFSRNTFDLSYSITTKAYKLSKLMKMNLTLPSPNTRQSYASYWGDVYGEVLDKEKIFINEMADSLNTINASQTYTRSEFADVIVTFVQDIPYSYVFSSQSCDTTVIPCVSGQLFGIHTPTEFLYTLQGDCDTRSIILCGVLRHFGYDARIAVSYAYAHALIVIDLNSNGDYISHQGKKYYFWETTATGWERGFIPPSCSDITKWKIAL